MALQAIKLTSKRQATFPARLCEEMAVKPGDKLLLERREVDGELAWVIHTEATIRRPWFGMLRKYARGKSHDMADIRQSIGRKRGKERS